MTAVYIALAAIVVIVGLFGYMLKKMTMKGLGKQDNPVDKR